MFKFVEPPENNEKPNQRNKAKFKIMSLKVKGDMEYKPELVSSLLPIHVNLIVDWKSHTAYGLASSYANPMIIANAFPLFDIFGVET